MSSSASPSHASSIGWVLLFGVLAAWALEKVEAFWIGALCGYLFGRVRALQQGLEALTERLDCASVPAPVPETVRETTASERVVAETSEPMMASASIASPLAPGWSDPAPLAAPASGTVREAVESPIPTKTAPSLLDQAFDWAKGGNPLARLGVLITFIGAVYLIRYAAEAGYLPVELRLAGLSAAALAMVGFGWRLRTRVVAYALTLQGGGLALLYLTVLAAFRLYQLLPPTFAFALLVLVASASALLAVSQSALPLAVIGFAGGFVAPLLLGGDGSHLALFGYYTVLNLGVFAIAAFRGWSGLNLLGFVFTFVITALWRATSYRPELFASAEFFLLLFFALYVFVTVLSARSGPKRGLVSGTLTFGLPAVVLSLQTSLVVDFEHGLAISAAGFGLFYLIVAAGLLLSGREHWRTTGQAFTAIGVVLLSLAVPLYFDDQATAATWALEGAGAVWLGMRQNDFRTRFFGVLVQVLAGGSLLIGIDQASPAQGAFAIGVPGALLLAAAGFSSGYWLKARAETLGTRERLLPMLVPVWALGWWLYAGLAQIDYSDDRWFIGLALSFGAATAAALYLASRRLDSQGLAWPWLARLSQASLLLFALIGAIAAIVERPSGQGGAVGWILLIATHYLILWHTERQPAGPRESIPHVLPALLKTWLGSLELAWQLRRLLGGDWPNLAYGLVPGFALALIALFPNSGPMVRHRALYALWIGGPIALWLMVWMLASSITDLGDAAPLNTLPLLNPLDLTVIAAVAVLTAFWHRRRRDDWCALEAVLPSWLLPSLAAGIAFVWLNSALTRGLHYSLGTPFDVRGMLDSALLQASYSMLWSLLGFGAMLIAARHARREVWLAGAGLMVVVAIKLFVVDTAGTGTLAQIAAFLFVGAILLVAGYLAPLPPARRSAAD